MVYFLGLVCFTSEMQSTFDYLVGNRRKGMIASKDWFLLAYIKIDFIYYKFESYYEHSLKNIFDRISWSL